MPSYFTTGQVLLDSRTSAPRKQVTLRPAGIGGWLAAGTNMTGAGGLGACAAAGPATTTASAATAAIPLNCARVMQSSCFRYDGSITTIGPSSVKVQRQEQRVHSACQCVGSAYRKLTVLAVSSGFVFCAWWSNVVSSFVVSVVLVMRAGGGGAGGSHGGGVGFGDGLVRVSIIPPPHLAAVGRASFEALLGMRPLEAVLPGLDRPPPSESKRRAAGPPSGTIEKSARFYGRQCRTPL